MSDSGEKSFIHLILAKLGMIKIGEKTQNGFFWRPFGGGRRPYLEHSIRFFGFFFVEHCGSFGMG